MKVISKKTNNSNNNSNNNSSIQNSSEQSNRQDKKYSKLTEKYKKGKNQIQEVCYVPKSEQNNTLQMAEVQYDNKEDNSQINMRATNKVYKDNSHYQNKKKYNKRKNH